VNVLPAHCVHVLDDHDLHAQNAYLLSDHAPHVSENGPMIFQVNQTEERMMDAPT
jgi:hypothetical protein